MHSNVVEGVCSKGQHGGAEVGTVASQQKGRGSIPGPGDCMFTLPEWLFLLINLIDYFYN